MKRFWISMGMLLAIVCFCAWTVGQVYEMQEEMHGRIDGIFAAVAREDREAALEQATALGRYWKQEEKRLMHFLRHSQIDDITFKIARLEPLALSDDLSELLAELSSIQRQVTHVWESEIPTLKNIF